MPIDVKIEGTKELSNALVEIFSPVTNLLGTLGDRVRVYRQLSLMRSLKRAQEIAKEENLVLREPPLKFLVPFLEDCSLEEPENEQLIEMWAKLLTTSATQYRSEHALFIRTLRELGSSEARLLTFLASKDTHTDYQESWSLENIAFGWHDPYIYGTLKALIDGLGSKLSDSSPFSKIEYRFRAEVEQPGVAVSFFDVARGVKGTYPLESIHTNERSEIDDFERSTFAILRALGLISEYVSSEFWFGKYVFDIRAYYLTELGAHFIESCTRLPTHGSRSAKK